MSEKMRTAMAIVPADEEAEYSTLSDVSSTEQPQYFCLLTRAGAELEAAAHSAGKPVRLFCVAVGDGNGQVPMPEESRKDLVHEVYRKNIDSMSRDTEDPSICWIHVVIPADAGGFWIREFGVFAEALESGGQPVLFAYGNHAPYYKLKRILGQAITHELSIPLIMSSTSDVEILIAETGYASRVELLHLSGIVESLRHPKEAVWNLASDIPVNGTLNLPAGISYVPGRNLVDLSWDGLVCYPGEQFSELGSPNTVSNSLKLLFAAPRGSQFRILVRGYSLQPELPDGSIENFLESRVNALEQSMCDVSDGAAYIIAPK